MSKFRGLLLKYKEYILYVVFGGGTSVVDLGVYYLLVNMFRVNYLIAQAVSWVGAVAFAYATNRKWVFESNVHGVGAVCSEAAKFAGGRLFSLGVQTVCLYVLVDMFHKNENIVRLPVLILVIIINYVVSKLLVFNDRNDGGDDHKDHNNHSKMKEAADGSGK